MNVKLGCTMQLLWSRQCGSNNAGELLCTLGLSAEEDQCTWELCKPTCTCTKGLCMSFCWVLNICDIFLYRVEFC